MGLLHADDNVAFEDMQTVNASGHSLHVQETWREICFDQLVFVDIKLQMCLLVYKAACTPSIGQNGIY